MSGKPTGETYDLSPDWEAVAREYERRGQPEMAEKARNQDLSKKELYKGV